MFVYWNSCDFTGIRTILYICILASAGFKNVTAEVSCERKSTTTLVQDCHKHEASNRKYGVSMRFHGICTPIPAWIEVPKMIETFLGKHRKVSHFFKQLDCWL